MFTGPIKMSELAMHASVLGHGARGVCVLRFKAKRGNSPFESGSMSSVRALHGPAAIVLPSPGFLLPVRHAPPLKQVHTALSEATSLSLSVSLRFCTR